MKTNNVYEAIIMWSRNLDNMELILLFFLQSIRDFKLEGLTAATFTPFNEER